MTTIAMEMMMLLMLSTGEDPPNMYRPGPKGSFLMLIIQEFIYMYTMKAGHPRKPVSGLRGGLGTMITGTPYQLMLRVYTYYKVACSVRLHERILVTFGCILELVSSQARNWCCDRNGV